MSEPPYTGDPEATRRAALSPILGVADFQPLSSAALVQFGAKSDTGLVAAANDDNYLIMRMGRDQETVATSLSLTDVPQRFEERGYAMVVADGLGPGGSGSVASRVALSTLAHLVVHFGKWNVRIDQNTATDVFERAEWYYSQIDAAVRARAQTSPELKCMTTALTAAYSTGDELFVAHVGHSRAYLFRDGQLTLLTRDHTVAHHTSESQRPIPVERRALDLSHILTDAVGAPGGYPMVEIDRFTLAHGDSVMLCTNGLTDMVSHDEIAEVLARRRKPQEQCEALVDLANRHGGVDNVTVLLAEYHIR